MGGSLENFILARNFQSRSQSRIFLIFGPSGGILIARLRPSKLTKWEFRPRKKIFSPPPPPDSPQAPSCPRPLAPRPLTSPGRPPLLRFSINRGQKLNPNIFFSNFSGASGISRQNPGISRQKSLIPWVSRDIPNFLAPTPSRGRPPPHQKISGLKSLGLSSFSCLKKKTEPPPPPLPGAWRLFCSPEQKKYIRNVHQVRLRRRCAQMRPDMLHKRRTGLFLGIPIAWYKARIPGFPRKSIREGASSLFGRGPERPKIVSCSSAREGASSLFGRGPESPKIVSCSRATPRLHRCNLKDHLLLPLSIFGEIQEFGHCTRQSGSQETTLSFFSLVFLFPWCFCSWEFPWSF